MALSSSCYLILVGMGMHWLGYDIGIAGTTEQVNCLAYVETYFKI
jgi:hypothetical protein